jgi:hypothetical protein
MSEEKKVLMIESCEKKVINNDFSNTSIVHVRNSVIMRDEMSMDLIAHVSQIKDALKSKYDTIIAVYASPYMKYKMYMDILDNNPSAKIAWEMADHDGEDNILLRNYIKKTKKGYDFICNNPRSGYRHWILAKNIEEKRLNDFIDDWRVVNLNTLIFERRAPYGNDQLKTRKGCLYYGTFRKWRAEDMARFNGIKDYTISSSIKNQDKYTEANIKAHFIDKIEWKKGEESLLQYKYSIYFEDLNTHDNYAFPANRFYECLMCDTLMFFDARCENTIAMARKQGYIIDPFMVTSGPEDMNKKINILNADFTRYTKQLNIQRLNVDVALADRSSAMHEMELFCEEGRLPANTKQKVEMKHVERVLLRLKESGIDFEVKSANSQKNNGFLKSDQTGRLPINDWQTVFVKCPDSESVKKCRNLEKYFRDRGVYFDIGNYLSFRTWELDWSMRFKEIKKVKK